MYRNFENCFSAPGCHDSRPVISPMGRGPKGDSFSVKCEDFESEAETILTGYEFDETEGKWKELWQSGNINGGRLSCDVNYKSENGDNYFQLKFVYTRPGRTEWTVLTPWITYAGEAPEPGEEPVDVIDLAKVLGLTLEQVNSILSDIAGVITSPTYKEIKGDNIVDYIDKLIAHVNDLIEQGGGGGETKYEGSEHIEVDNTKYIISLKNFATYSDIDRIFA